MALILPNTLGIYGMLEALFYVNKSCPWISELQKHGSGIKIVSCRPVFRGSGASAFVSFHTQFDVEALQHKVSSLPDVMRAVFKKTGKQLGVGMVDSVNCPCSRLGLSYKHILRIEVDEKGMVFHILMSNRNEVKELLRDLNSQGVDAKLVKIRKLNVKQFLTPRQEQVLMHALVRGYFQYPRPNSINSMAKEFGISTPAYTELLRKALAKMVTLNLV